MKLEDCVPKSKHDAIAIRNAEAIGFPAINPIIGKLLEWVQDINWPVAHRTAILLRGAGPEVSPYIVDVLRGGDDVWKTNILEQVAGYLSQDAWLLIADDVERIARNPTPSEVAECADEAARGAIAMRP